MRFVSIDLLNTELDHIRDTVRAFQEKIVIQFTFSGKKNEHVLLLLLLFFVKIRKLYSKAFALAYDVFDENSL